MPSLSRQPHGPFEARIDYDQIAKSQEVRLRTTLAQLRAVLRRVEGLTLKWAAEEIIRKRRTTAVAKYRMPLFFKYREVMRRKTTSANRRGRSDAMGELGLSTPPMRQPAMSRARARADALARDHRDRLETDLQRELTKATEGTVTPEAINYVIKKVFADFAGWDPPESP